MNNYNFENYDSEEKEKKPKKPGMNEIFIVPKKLKPMILKKKKLIKSLTPK
jgi:hypothetical protein